MPRATGSWPGSSVGCSCSRTRPGSWRVEVQLGNYTRAYPHADELGPVLEGRLTRARIPRTNDYAQPGERFMLMQDWERDDLVA
ncbi:MAG TPA: hypothetical protein VGO23_13570, partial [Pseudonocardia sp.]|nr:hypothetical protein [Pseudonocardia sp.]